MALATYKDLCIDAVDPHLQGSFWAVALGWEHHPHDDGGSCLRGADDTVHVCVNKVPEPKVVKNRVHLDVNTEAVDRLVAAGATVVDAESFRWAVMRDPDGQEFCAFVRDDVTSRRLNELVWDCAGSPEECRRLAAWWATTLDGQVVEDRRGFSWVEQIPGAPFESMDFVPVPEPKTAKNRVHIDVTTDALDSLVEHGATVLRPKGTDGIEWNVMADPAGNEFCAFTM